MLRMIQTTFAVLALLTQGTSVIAETAVERGRYLATSIMACGTCHTPRGPDNSPLAGMELAGGYRINAPVFVAYAQNITQDAETGIGKWTDAQIVTAIREGRRPDGSIIGAPMSIGMYRGLSDNDVNALVAYLRTVKAVRNIAPKSEYKMPLPKSYGPPVGRIADVARDDKVAYGRYLAGPAGHCIECHSPRGPKGPDIENNLGAGGALLMNPAGPSVSTNITPTGLAKYSDAEIRQIITTGVRPDGSRLKLPMAIPYYAKITPADLDALVAYLRALPSK